MHAVAVNPIFGVVIVLRGAFIAPGTGPGTGLGAQSGVLALIRAAARARLALARWTAAALLMPAVTGDT